MVRIACLPDCIYLDAGQEYQQKRLSDQFAHARREFYQALFDLGGEKAASLFNLIEVVGFGYFQHRRDGLDTEFIAGMEMLRRTASPLHIPAAPPQAFAEQLKREYETFTKQQAQQAPDTEVAMDVLDRAIKFVTEFSGGTLSSQRFLTGLIGYIKAYHPDLAAHLARQADGGRIVIPGQFTPGAVQRTDTLSAAAGHEHQHHPGCRH